MLKLTRLLKETMTIKALSPEKAAPFIGCSGKQIRMWISGEVDPSPLFIKAIESGIRKINRQIPGDTPEGVVSWRKGPEISEQERIVNKKLNIFFDAMITAARSTGRRIVFTSLDDENLDGFEQTVHLAAKLKVKLPEL